MIGVIDKGRVFRFPTDHPRDISWVDLQPLAADSRPDHVSLERYFLDLHFGHGLFGPISSRLFNDVGGLGTFILCLTGVFYWALPKLWRYTAGRRSGNRNSSVARKATILWLFRLHSVTIGILSVVAILYLSVTGVFIGHYRELGTWMKAASVSQAWLTPSYRLSDWDGWIDSIAAYPGQPDKLTIGNRVGLFTSTDGGKSWSRERNQEGDPVAYATKVRRIGNYLLIPNGMSGPSFIRDSNQKSHEVVPNDESEGAGTGGMAGMFMPSDVTANGDRFTWRSMDNLLVTDADGMALERRPFRQPMDPGVPWFTFFVRIHNGAIFWTEWRWANDVFAVLAVLLTVTGLIRWWRKKYA
jgi:hypothetical protein